MNIPSKCAEHRRYTPGCAACRRAAARWQKCWRVDRQFGRPRRLPVEPYVQLIGQLMALGWPGAILAARMGWQSRYALNPSRLREQQWVSVETAEKLIRIYTDLENTVGPSVITAARARRAGFAPPGEARIHDAA